MPWTIDLLMEYSSYSRVTKLSTNLNCPGKWCQRLCSNWLCLDNWHRRLSINWICSGKCLRGLSNNWNCLNNWCLVLQLIGIIQTNDFGDCLSIGIVLNIVLAKLSINWKCASNLFRVMYMNWNCWDNCADNCFRRLSINSNYLDNRVLEGSVISKQAATTLKSTVLRCHHLSQDGEVLCTPNLLEGTAVLCFITSSINSMVGVY